MLNTNPDLQVGDKLYGCKIVQRTTADSNRLISVIVQLSNVRTTCAFWFTDLPDGQSGWVPTQVGPHGSYAIQNTANPNWWTREAREGWVCIHNTRRPGPSTYDELCDGECGEPDVPLVFPTEEEVAEHAERALRLLASVRP